MLAKKETKLVFYISWNIVKFEHGRDNLKIFKYLQFILQQIVWPYNFPPTKKQQKAYFARNLGRFDPCLSQLHGVLSYQITNNKFHSYFTQKSTFLPMKHSSNYLPQKPGVTNILRAVHLLHPSFLGKDTALWFTWPSEKKMQVPDLFCVFFYKPGNRDNASKRSRLFGIVRDKRIFVRRKLAEKTQAHRGLTFNC